MSTLMRLIAGELAPSSGGVNFDRGAEMHVDSVAHRGWQRRRNFVLKRMTDARHDG
jgi:ATPase subunit of ABC transporter with duplicated ATPase domains